MLDLLIMYVIMAGVFTFGKQAVLNSSPFFLTGIRLASSGFLFMLGTYLFDRKKWYLHDRLLPSLVGVMVFFLIMDASRFVGLQYVPSAHSALIASLAPFIAALFANLVFKEKFTFKKLVALCIGFFGVLPLIIQNVLDTPLTESPLISMGGYACALLSTTSAVVGSFFLKKLVDKEKYSIFMSLGISLFAAGVIALVVSVLIEPWNPIPVTNIKTVLPLVGFLFLFHNLIAQPLYGFLVKKYPVTLVTFGNLITPVAACLIGYCCYGQPINRTFMFSLLTLMASFYLFYHEEQKEGLV